MPKKFHGENTKSAEARARRQAQQNEEKTRKEKEAEDAFWRDDDKLVNRKLQRREERDKKVLEKVERKLENKAMHEAEMEKIAGAKTGGPSKVTQAEITSLQERQRREREEEAEKQRLEARNISVQNDLVEENINRMRIEGQEARTIEQAIGVLSSDKESGDRHPEKRMKAAYTTFEEKNLPRLKEENPNLRLSQLKQILKKEWLKSPENPMFQKAFAAADDREEDISD